MAGRINEFRALTHQERMLFMEALILQVKTGIVLKIIPFRWIPRIFSGAPSGIHSQQSAVCSVQSTVCSPQSAVHSLQSAVHSQQSAVSSQQSAVSSLQSTVSSQQSAVYSDEPSRLNLDAELLEQIKTATRRASYISPWKNKCLVSSLAARRMLNRRKIPSRISLGVARAENGKMIAHAWLRAGDYEIVVKGHEFHELYSF